MRCPFCDAEKESLKVIDSRTCEGGRAIRRRRQCLACVKRFTTYERIEENIRLTVIKKDGSRVPFDRAKILSGLERACYKRPVQEEDLHRIVDEVEEDVHKAYDKEVPSTVIGGLVTERLRRLDQVAYVRFASVYRQFKTLDELVEEAKAVIDAQRYDDLPGQGRLFIDAKASGRSAAVAGGERDRPRANAGGAKPEREEGAGLAAARDRNEQGADDLPLSPEGSGTGDRPRPENATARDRLPPTAANGGHDTVREIKEIKPPKARRVPARESVTQPE